MNPGAVGGIRTVLTRESTAFAHGDPNLKRAFECGPRGNILPFSCEKPCALRPRTVSWLPPVARKLLSAENILACCQPALFGHAGAM